MLVRVVDYQNDDGREDPETYLHDRGVVLNCIVIAESLYEDGARKFSIGRSSRRVARNPRLGIPRVP